MKLFRNGLTVGVTQLSKAVNKHIKQEVKMRWDNKTNCRYTHYAESNYIKTCLQVTLLLRNISTGESYKDLYFIIILHQVFIIVITKAHLKVFTRQIVEK